MVRIYTFCVQSVGLCVSYDSQNNQRLLFPWIQLPGWSFYGTSSICGWRKRRLDMEDSCDYIERVAESRQEVVLQVGVWVGADNSKLNSVA
jgi:hypothetical protein